MDCVILAVRTGTLSRNVGINYQAAQCNIAEKSRPQAKFTVSTNLLLFTRERLSRIPRSLLWAPHRSAIPRGACISLASRLAFALWCWCPRAAYCG